MPHPIRFGVRPAFNARRCGAIGNLRAAQLLAQ